MLYIAWTRQPRRFLEQAPMDLQQRLREKIEHLLTAPVPHDAKHYHQLPGKVFRVRVGDYRIVYELVPAKETILILIIDKRSRVYD